MCIQTSLRTLRPLQRVSARRFSTSSTLPDELARDFTFFRDYLSVPEQRLLLAAALDKLDQKESARFRRQRKPFGSRTSQLATPGTVSSLFLPDEHYDFEESHYDSVIKRYREMHLTSWPEDVPGLPQVLDRLRSLHPNSNVQTHLLHLASDGEILPHVDNLEASGSWILGVSLGDERILRLDSTAGEKKRYEMALPSGSVYIQKDTVRYGYEHSILKRRDGDSVPRGVGQRLSVMIRPLK